VRILLVVNSFASSVTARNTVVVHRRLARTHDVEVVETNRRGHATRFAHDAARRGVDVVIGYGGDGTLNEVATGIAGTDSALGVLPGGSTNVFARTLGMPNDPVAAAEFADCLIKQQKWSEARRVLAPFAQENGDARCRFLDVFAETGAAPEFFDEVAQGDTRRRTQSEDQPQRARIRATWNHLLDRWSRLAIHEDFRAYSLVNLAWVQFHMSMDADCRDTLDQISSVTTSDGKIGRSLQRLRENLFIGSRLMNPASLTSKHLDDLSSNARRDGLRGEVLLLLNVLRVPADDPGSVLTDKARDERVRDCVAVLQRHVGPDIHPSDVESFLSSRSLARTSHRQAVLNALRTPIRPKSTNLIHVLVMP